MESPTHTQQGLSALSTVSCLTGQAGPSFSLPSFPHQFPSRELRLANRSLQETACCPPPPGPWARRVLRANGDTGLRFPCTKPHVGPSSRLSFCSVPSLYFILPTPISTLVLEPHCEPQSTWLVLITIQSGSLSPQEARPSLPRKPEPWLRFLRPQPVASVGTEEASCYWYWAPHHPCC